MWVNGTENNNAAWPGAQMEKVEGKLYTYTVPVSYTHLDVYKRQVSHRPSDSPLELCFPRYGIFRKVTGRQDVYKRQVLMTINIATDSSSMVVYSSKVVSLSGSTRSATCMMLSWLSKLIALDTEPSENSRCCLLYTSGWYAPEIPYSSIKNTINNGTIGSFPNDK